MSKLFRTVTKEYYQDCIYDRIDDAWRIVVVEDLDASITETESHEVVMRRSITKVIKKWWEIWK